MDGQETSAKFSSATVTGLDHVVPSYVVAVPSKPTEAQKLASAHDTALGRPVGSTRIGADQPEPSNVTA